jgi:ligand-binding SRPBCC domain-containing protein
MVGWRDGGWPIRTWPIRAWRNREHVLRTELRLALPRDEVFRFFAAAENLERITPPELRFRIITPTPVEVRAGTLIDYRLSLFGLPFVWRTEITEWDPPHSFVDTQLRGPYAQWIHRHTFRDDAGDTVIGDEVRYRLPVPLLGEAGLPVVKLQLRRIFRHREARIRELLGEAVVAR